VAIYAGRGDIERAQSVLRVVEKDTAAAGGSLAPSMSSIGDYYTNRGQYDRATPYFRKAGRVGQTPQDVAYGLISEAACFLHSTRPKAAIRALESLLKLDGAPKQWVAQGRQLLEQARVPECG
jgi:tetratricopeptide (TPR) repeat protein